MTYKLLSLDIDGTLIGADETVAPEIVDAVAAADDAGLQVVLITGRPYDQTIGIWRQLRLRQPYHPLVLVSGALVAEPETGRTLYQKTIPRDLACQYADALADIGYSTLAFVDPWRHGWEYVVAESRDAEMVREKWFSRVQVKTRWVGTLAEASEIPNPLRLTAIVRERKEAEELAGAMRKKFDGLLCVNPLWVPTYDVTIIEATSARATKWTALMYVAQGLGVRPRDIVAVGDDANDLPMIERAGLGVAMPHAPDYVLTAADHVASAGLAPFLRELLTGKLERT